MHVKSLASRTRSSSAFQLLHYDMYAVCAHVRSLQYTCVCVFDALDLARRIFAIMHLDRRVEMHCFAEGPIITYRLCWHRPIHNCVIIIYKIIDRGPKGLITAAVNVSRWDLPRAMLCLCRLLTAIIIANKLTPLRAAQHCGKTADISRVASVRAPRRGGEVSVYSHLASAMLLR